MIIIGDIIWHLDRGLRSPRIPRIGMQHCTLSHYEDSSRSSGIDNIYDNFTAIGVWALIILRSPTMSVCDY